MASRTTGLMDLGAAETKVTPDLLVAGCRQNAASFHSALGVRNQAGTAIFSALSLPRIQPCAIARRNFLGIHLIV